MFHDVSRFFASFSVRFQASEVPSLSFTFVFLRKEHEHTLSRRCGAAVAVVLCHATRSVVLVLLRFCTWESAD